MQYENIYYNLFFGILSSPFSVAPYDTLTKIYQMSFASIKINFHELNLNFEIRRTVKMKIIKDVHRWPPASSKNYRQAVFSYCAVFDRC